MKKIGHIAGRPIWDSEGELLLKGSLIANIERSETGEITGITINLKESLRVPPMNLRPVKPLVKNFISYTTTTYIDYGLSNPLVILNTPWKDTETNPNGFCWNVQRVVVDGVDVSNELYTRDTRASGISPTMFNTSDLTPATHTITIELKEPKLYGSINLFLGARMNTLNLNNIPVDVNKIHLDCGYNTLVSNLVLESSLGTIPLEALRDIKIATLIIPSNIEHIEMYGLMAVVADVYDFSNVTTVPTLEDVMSLPGVSYRPQGKIVVPKNLYNEWITTTNWNHANIKPYIYYKDSNGQLSQTPV